MASTSLQDKMKLAAGSFAANDFESALNSFQECLTLTTNEKALRIIQTNIGATFQRMSRFDDALKAFDSALSYDETYLQALFNKGVTLKALNKLNEALETFNKVLSDLVPSVYILQETKRKESDPPLKDSNLTNYQKKKKVMEGRG